MRITGNGGHILRKNKLVDLEVAVQLRGGDTVAGYRKPEGEWGVGPAVTTWISRTLLATSKTTRISDWEPFIWVFGPVIAVATGGVLWLLITT